MSRMYRADLIEFRVESHDVFAVSNGRVYLTESKRTGWQKEVADGHRWFKEIAGAEAAVMAAIAQEEIEARTRIDFLKHRRGVLENEIFDRSHKQMEPDLDEALK